jgi:uncharacterized membrane protein required for colicin V production
MVLSILAKLLDKLVRVPVLKQINRILGFLLGVAVGGISSWMAVTIVSTVATLMVTFFQSEALVNLLSVSGVAQWIASFDFDLGAIRL